MHYYTLSSIEFRKILKEVSETAVKNALIATGLDSSIIWRTDAIKMYGEKLIKRLEKHQMIKKRQHYPKGNYYFEVAELNYSLTTENRHRFFVHEKVGG